MIRLTVADIFATKPFVPIPIECSFVNCSVLQLHCSEFFLSSFNTSSPKSYDLFDLFTVNAMKIFCTKLVHVTPPCFQRAISLGFSIFSCPTNHFYFTLKIKLCQNKAASIKRWLSVMAGTILYLPVRGTILHLSASNSAYCSLQSKAQNCALRGRRDIEPGVATLLLQNPRF